MDKTCTTNTYRIFEDLLHIYCDCAPMGEHIHCFMRNLLAPEEATDRATVRLAVFEAPQGQVTLCCPEVALAKVVRLGIQSWIGFRHLLMRLLLSEDRPYCPLHAACVADGAGRAALLVGARDAGKTSLLAALLKRGFRLAADDYAMLGLEQADVVALPTGVTAEDRFFRFFPEFEERKRDSCKFFCQGRWQWTLNLTDVYEGVPAYGRLRPTHVYFIRPNFGGESRIDPCERDEALWWLHSSTIDPFQFASGRREYSLTREGQFLDLARRLLSSAVFCRILNGNLERAADFIAASFGT